MYRDNQEGSIPGAAGSASPRPAEGKLFLRLFLENQPRLFGYIFSLLPNRADADDVLQEVSLVMWEKFDENCPPDDFAAWGCRIAYHKVLGFLRTSRRSRVCFSQPMLDRLVETLAEHSSAMHLDERREALADCVEKLSPRDRDLLTRRFAPGATTQSAAAELKLSLDTVYKAITRIRHALCRCVEAALG